MEYLTYADWLLRAAAALVFTVSGVTIMERRRDGAGKLMGWAALTLCIGAACDLLQRVLGAGALGQAAGRMVWFLSLTLVPILLSLLWEKLYGQKLGYYAEMLLRDVSGIRALACVALPVVLLSGVMGGDGYDPFAGMPLVYRLIAPGLRSVMLCVAAADVARLWHKTRDEIPALRDLWLWLTAAAAFEIAAELGSVFIPALEKLELLSLACLAALVLCLLRDAGAHAGEIE